MRSVLVVAYVFPPMAGSGVQRTLKFVKYLPGLGWLPAIITARPYPGHVSDPSMCREVPAEVSTIRCNSLEFRRAPARVQRVLASGVLAKVRRMLEVSDHCIGWLPFAIVAARRLVQERQPDLIYTSFPPATALIIGYLLQRRHRLPWVVDLRDPWTQHPKFLSNVPRIYRPLIHWLERLVLRSASRVVVATESMKEDLLGANPWLPAERVCVITNGFDEDDFQLCQTGKTQECFTVTYAGTPGSMDLSAFVKAVSSLLADGTIDRQRFRLRFVGDVQYTAGGQAISPLSRLIGQSGLSDLTEFTGYLSHHESIEAISQASVLLLFSWGPNFHMSKTFEYLRARKPILTLAREGDEITGLIRGAEAGTVVPPNDQEGIKEALRQLYCDWKLGRDGGHCVGDSFVAQFERKVLTRRLAEIFDGLVSTDVGLLSTCK